MPVDSLSTCGRGGCRQDHSICLLFGWQAQCPAFARQREQTRGTTHVSGALRSGSPLPRSHARFLAENREALNAVQNCLVPLGVPQDRFELWGKRRTQALQPTGAAMMVFRGSLSLGRAAAAELYRFGSVRLDSSRAQGPR